MEFAGNDDEWRDRPALGVDALNHCNPFPITLLGYLRPSTPLSACNDYARGDDADHEACLVEVVDIRFLYAILRDYVPYKPKLRVYRVWIFAEGSLEVIGT